MSDHTPEDALDAALDRLPNSSPGAPEWLMPLDARFRELDSAFARRADRREMANLVYLSPEGKEVPAPIDIWDTLPRNWVSSRLRVASFAAVLVLMLFGTLALAGNPGDWFAGDERPFGASIPAAGTPADQAFAEGMVVTPSSCTIPPLTRERYDQAMVGKTPITSSNSREVVIARNNEIEQLIDPEVMDGRVVLTGGSLVPREISNEISADLARYLACTNRNDRARSVGFFSDSFLPLLGNLDTIFAEDQATAEPEGPTIKQLRVDQMRLLEDGRVAAVVTFVADEPAYVFPPDPTPTGTLAIDGHVLVFVKTAEGWRIDYSNTGEVFRLPLPADTNVNATPVPTAGPIVVTPGACTQLPMSEAQFEATVRANGVRAGATPVATTESGRTVAEEEMRAYYVALLDREVRDGKVVFTAGRPADVRTTEEIASRIGGFYGCGMEGTLTAWLQFISTGYLGLFPSDTEYPVDGTPAPAELMSVFRVELSQFRELPDGRVMAVMTYLMTPEQMSEYFDFSYELVPPTPENSVTPTGVVFIFVETDAGWKVDFQIGPDAFRMPLVTGEATPALPQT